MKYLITLSFICLLYSAKGQAKGDTTNPTHWREIDGKHVYSYFEGSNGNIWAMGRDRQNTGYSNPGEAVRLNPFDTIPTVNDIIFLMQQNKELSDRLDRAERRIDILMHELQDDNKVDALTNKYMWEQIDSIEKRPYLFIDKKGVRPGVWLTNSAGEYQIFIVPIK